MAHHHYTDEQINWMVANRSGCIAPEFARLFNEKFKTEIKVTALTAVCKRRNIAAGRTGKFKKGQIPPNKGKFGVRNSPGSEFKKGNRPRNTAPIGAEVIDKEGYLKIKTAEPNVWKNKQIHIWEQHHGKTKPKNHAVLFLDNNNRNFAIENLQLISRNAHAICNKRGWSKEPPEIRRTLIAIAELQAKTNKLTRTKQISADQ